MSAVLLAYELSGWEYRIFKSVKIRVAVLLSRSLYFALYVFASTGYSWDQLKHFFLCFKQCYMIFNNKNFYHSSTIALVHPHVLNTWEMVPRARFSKVQKSFRTRKAVAKFQILWFYSHILYLNKSSLHIRSVKGIHCTPVVRYRNVLGAFEKQAPGPDWPATSARIVPDHLTTDVIVIFDSDQKTSNTSSCIYKSVIFVRC